MTIKWSRRALAFANKMQNGIFFSVFSLQSPTLKPALELQVIAPHENFHTSELRDATAGEPCDLTVKESAGLSPCRSCLKVIRVVSLLSTIFCFIFACSDSLIISKNIIAPIPTQVNEIWTKNILKMLNYRLKHFWSIHCRFWVVRVHIWMWWKWTKSWILV